MKPTSIHALLTVALLTLAGTGPLIAFAQQPGPPPEPPSSEETEELAREIAIHVLAMAETNEMVASNALASFRAAMPLTNGPGQARPTAAGQPSPRRDYDRDRDRSSFGRSSRDSSGYSRSSRSEASQTPGQFGGGTRNASGTTNSLGRPDFSNFRIIADRNIFDPNRRPYRASAPRERPKLVETFSLVGVMSYEKGTFAFFDGSSSTYRKALQQNDTIAGYRLADINSSAVKLAAGTNELELRVGGQLRREDEGEWIPSRRSETFAAAGSAANNNPTPTTSTDSASSGGDSDVLRRLRERRETE